VLCPLHLRHSARFLRKQGPECVSHSKELQIHLKSPRNTQNSPVNRHSKERYIYGIARDFCENKDQNVSVTQKNHGYTQKSHRFTQESLKNTQKSPLKKHSKERHTYSIPHDFCENEDQNVLVSEKSITYIHTYKYTYIYTHTRKHTYTYT